MPDWARFRERMLEGEMRYRALLRIREFTGWLDLPIAEAIETAKKQYDKLTDSDAKEVFSGLLTYRFKMIRDAGMGVTDAEVNAKLNELFKMVYEGGGSPEQQVLAKRLWNLLQITGFVTQAHPSVVQPVTAESVASDKAFVDSTGAIFPRLMKVMKATQAGSDVSENVAELIRLDSEYRKLATSAINTFQSVLVAGLLGNTNYFLGANYTLLKEVEKGKAAYEEAAAWCEKAGQLDQAAECRRRAEDITRTGDLDHAFGSALEMQSPDDDVISKAKALAATSAATTAAGDHFESLRISDEIATTLKSWDLLDPQEVGFDAAIDSWIRNLPAKLSGTAYFKAFHDVHACYLRVLAARSQDPNDKKRSQEAYRLCLKDGAESDEFDVVSTSGLERLQAESELEHQWAPYLLPGAQAVAGTSADDAEQAREKARSQQLRSALEIAWGKLHDDSGSRDWTDAQEDLLEQATKLEEQAATLKLPFYDAKAKMMRGEVLLNSRRLKDAVSVLEEARKLILGAKPMSYGTYAGESEQGVYELILNLKARAQAQSEDLQGWSDTCEEAIRTIEAQRYAVNSPEQQNSFLGWRANFYIWGVAAARKGQHWDQMLERMELVKARSLIRSRLLPEAPELDLSKLAGQFRDVCDQLQKATDQKASENLGGERRRLWDLMSIARARERTSAHPPEISVANVQKVLGEDEAAISYFWQTGSVLLAVVVERNNFKVERIEFSADDLELYSQYVEAIQTLSSSNDCMDEMTAQLGEVLLPAAVREMIGGKRRLIISPHKTLHLFPLHAAVWGDEFIGQKFAVSYAPNLSSLLLPWRVGKQNSLLALGIRKFQTPPFDKHELRLAETEAQEVQKIYAAKGVQADLLCGPDASREGYNQVREKLASYRCLHLATHGTSVFQAETRDHPMEARLMLEDGWLDGLEIAESRLEADLVVLSACSSGQRAVAGRGMQDVPGDDVFGLQSAFFNSGVRAVLGALWPLRDEQAYELAIRFHTFFSEGNDADISLQQAVNGYLKDNSGCKIFDWAGLFLSTLGKNGSLDKLCRI